MNRAFVNTAGNINLPQSLVNDIQAQAQAVLDKPAERQRLHGEGVHIDCGGKRYTGKGSISAVNDLQFTVQKVGTIPTEAKASATAKRGTAKKAAPKKAAAKKAAPKKAAKKK